MPVPINATVGDPAANSYVDVNTADTYLGAHLFGAAWTSLAAGSDKKPQALITVTRILNSRRYQGGLSSNTQALEWPRIYVPRPYDPNIQLPPGTLPLLLDYYDPTTIPTPVVEATCELALELLRVIANPFGQDDTANMVTDRVGPLTAQYVPAIDRLWDLERYPEVYRRIAPLLVSARRTRVVRS
jgi:hypothetical protein